MPALDSALRIAFPQPSYFGRTRYWKLSDLLAYEGALTGTRPEPIDPVDEKYLTSSQVRARYGGVSDMTLFRWTKGNPGSNSTSQAA